MIILFLLKESEKVKNNIEFLNIIQKTKTPKFPYNGEYLMNKGLKDIARAVKNFNRAGGESRQVIQGQIDALKGLKSQATLGGEAFRQLTKDVAEYEAKLKSVDAQIDSTGRKIKSLRQYNQVAKEGA